MRRYSITYFIGQSIKGLWRNSVMSTASVMVLMSCLVVMGSFALLVFNLNYNIDKLGMLNEIQAFVDTSLGYEGEIPEKDTEKPELDAASETAAAILEFENQVMELERFTDITQALQTASGLEEKLQTVRTAVDGAAKQNEQLYLGEVEKKFAVLIHRINSISKLEIQINKLDNVASVVFVSKYSALEYEKPKYDEFPDLYNRMWLDNPLPDKFIITYNDNSKVDTLQYLLDHMDQMLYKSNCHSEISSEIESIKQGVIIIFTWFLAILLIVSVFVIINTIKLAVFARRQEIGIMRYVGATNFFITLPFIFEGIIIGILASALAFAVQYYAYLYAQNIIINSKFLYWVSVLPFNEVKTQIIAGFAGVGILTGIIGSGASLRKYLSV